MNMLIAKVKPEHDKIKRARLVDLPQSQNIPVKPPAALHVRNENGAVIDLGYLECAGHVDVSCVLTKLPAARGRGFAAVRRSVARTGARCARLSRKLCLSEPASPRSRRTRHR